MPRVRIDGRVAVIGAALALALVLASEGSSHAEEPPRCGNAVLEAGEACDLGIGNEVGLRCTTACAVPRCGDGVLDVSEECDDGNLEDRDGCSSSCGDESRPRWISTFDSGTLGGEWFAAVASTPQGMVAVGQRAGEWPASAPVVVGYDREGRQRFEDLLWSGPGPGTANAVAAVVGDDGAGDGVVVVGTITDLTAREHPSVWRYDGDGTGRYALQLDEIGLAGTITAVVAMSSERVFVGGVHDPFVGSETGWLGELDPRDGTLRWFASLEGGRRVLDLVLAPDGSLVATGYSTATGTRTWLGAFELDGSPRWIDAVPTQYEQYWDRGMSVAVADDGSIYVAGLVGNGVNEETSTLITEIWLGAFEADGTPRWTQTQAGVEGTSSYARDVVLDAEGRPLVVGTIQTQPLLVHTYWDHDVWLRQYDRDGVVQWTWSYDGPLHQGDDGSAAFFTEEGSVVIAGSTAVRREGGNAWLAELDLGFASAGRSAQDSGARPPAARVLREPEPEPEPSVFALDERGPHRATLHIQFDGGTLQPGDRGSLHEVPCLASAIDFPGLALSAQSVQAIADRVAVAMSPYGVDVRVDDTLPSHLPRTTVMVGGIAEQLGLDPAVAGFACVVDCGDRWSSDFAFAFARDLPSIANNVLHEAAHTWGLDHVVAQDLLMYPLGASYDADWGSGCVEVSTDTSAPRCLDQHTQWCPPGQQDSNAELLAVFGPAVVDLDAPRLEIVAPESGTVLAPGEPLALELDVHDEDGDPGYRIVVPQLEWERVAYLSETHFELALPPGAFTVRVEAIDHAGNESVETIEVVVGEAPPPRVPTGDDPPPADDTFGPFEGLDDDGGCRVAGHGGRGGLVVLAWVLWSWGPRRRRRGTQRRAGGSHKDG